MEFYNTTSRLTGSHHAHSPVAVISDVHGRADLFREALLGVYDKKNTTLVLLGDYIDRGPDSLGCLNLINEVISGQHFRDVVVLPGNHEGLFSEALSGGTPERLLWMKNGGNRFFDEISGDLSIIQREMPRQIWNRLSQKEPAHYQNGSLLFVHAGLNPNIETKAFLSQEYRTPRSRREVSESWAWVRTPCLDYQGSFKGVSGEDVMLVHGHTSCEMTEDHTKAVNWILPETNNRICTDTSAAQRLPLIQIREDLIEVRIFANEPYLGYFL